MKFPFSLSLSVHGPFHMYNKKNKNPNAEGGCPETHWEVKRGPRTKRRMKCRSCRYYDSTQGLKLGVGWNISSPPWVPSPPVYRVLPGIILILAVTSQRSGRWNTWNSLFLLTDNIKACRALLFQVWRLHQNLNHCIIIKWYQ